MTDEDGRRQYSDEEFRAAITNGNRTTSEIADYVGCTRQGADYRLRKLREQGEIESEQLGGILVWSIREYENVGERIEATDNPLEDREIMKTLYVERDMSESEISNFLGCSVMDVAEWVNRHRLNE